MSNSVFTSDRKRSARRMINNNDDGDSDASFSRFAKSGGAPNMSGPRKWMEENSNYSWWLWTGIIVFGIVGVGLWAVRPDWVLSLESSDLLQDDVQYKIDWMRLFIWNIFITGAVLFGTWIFKSVMAT